MKKILDQVTAAHMRGPLDKLHELLASQKDGHYWLHQLTLMMRKEPTHVFTPQWMEELSTNHIWETAEEHFLETKELWFNKPKWPFQICVLNIGGMNNATFLKKWNKSCHDYWGKDLHNDIQHFLLAPETKKIHLIRLQERMLSGANFVKPATLADVNCPHPELNLTLCPPETAFFMRLVVKEYFDSQKTTVAMDFSPPDIVDETKTRFYYFGTERRDGNNIAMGAWDIARGNSSRDPNAWWIFQHEVQR